MTTPSDEPAEEHPGRSLTAHIHMEDPRYPILVIQGARFVYGLDIDPVTGDIDPKRRCICHARYDGECCCSL